jgi:DNA-binding NtrC family response regulator
MKQSYPGYPLLVVDDEPDFLEVVSDTLAQEGITNIVTTTESKEALALLRTKVFSTITLDLFLPEITGFELLSAALEECPSTPVIVVSGFDNVDIAVRCMRDGAFDYLLKPVDRTRLVTSIRHAIERWEIGQEISSLKKHVLKATLGKPAAFSAIITRDPGMVALFRYAEAIATTSLPILLTGETGVGKELMARAIHAASERSGPFVPVNVAGLDDTLFADTLFGHIKGAFTSAESRREGMIAKAEGGTLFLDEIGDLEPESQIKLLRLLQEGEYHPLGADKPRATHARFMFATNQDLAQLIKSGRFRSDLHYRLSSHHIHIPALRERKGDLILLVEHLLEKAAATLGKQKLRAPTELYALLRGYSLPGNLRELEGIIFDAAVRSKNEVLSLGSIRQIVGRSSHANSDGMVLFNPEENLFTAVPVLPRHKSAAEMLIQEAMRRSEGNQAAAARLIGVSRTTLIKRLKPRQ